MPGGWSSIANQVSYGFLNMQDMLANRITEVGVDRVNRAIDQTIAFYNSNLNSMLDSFVQKTTDFKIQYGLPQYSRLQGLDDSGRARPIKPINYYSREFPLREAGVAWGANYRAQKKMTVAEANYYTNVLTQADTEWIRDHMLASFFTNTNWTNNEEGRGAHTVNPLANGDSETYFLSTTGAMTTNQHYLAQAGSIATTNPFPTIYTELTHHPENQGDVVVFVPDSNVSDVKGRATFYPVADGNIRLGANSSQLIGDPSGNLPGELFGYLDGCFVKRWSALPSDYLIGITTDGPRPVAFRQEPEAELQGFKKVAERNDHPFYESQYLRIGGFGAWNRVGAVVQRVGSGSYAIPSNYTAPLP